MTDPVKLYRNPKSGHCHRVELMMALLGVAYETIDLDMMNGAHKAPDYLKLSPLGQVPAIDDNGTILSDSNAILTYLVHRHGEAEAWTGTTPVEKAEIQRWLSIAAGEIASGPAAARLAKVFGAPLDREAAMAKAHRLFAVMDAVLGRQPFLAAPRPTLADMAAYSYVAHAPEGGVSLAGYPNIVAWIGRIEALPDFIPMASSPIPSAA